MLIKSRETRRARYFSIKCASGQQVKLSHFKGSEKVRIEFYRNQDHGRLYDYFVKLHAEGKVHKVGSGFVTTGPRTPEQFKITLDRIAAL